MALTKEDLTEIGKLLQPITEYTEELTENVKELRQTTEELKQETKEIRQTTEELKQDTKELKQTTDTLKQTTEEIKCRVASLEMTIENETNKNIMRVAEGHLDLSRKLSAALKYGAEKEMLCARVNILEDEVRKIKAHMAIA